MSAVVIVLYQHYQILHLNCKANNIHGSHPCPYYTIHLSFAHYYPHVTAMLLQILSVHLAFLLVSRQLSKSQLVNY